MKKMKKRKQVSLIVEDEKPLQEAIKIKMEINGFDVVTARSVKQAMNLLEDIGKIDIIWLDHYLIGREDGLDFVVKVKNDKNWKKIPIIVVSNTASQEKLGAYIKLGIKKYYVKSNFRLDDIIKDIKK